MAKYCLRRLVTISKKGPRGKPPMIAEIETASVCKDPALFGSKDLSPMSRMLHLIRLPLVNH